MTSDPQALRFEDRYMAAMNDVIEGKRITDARQVNKALDRLYVVAKQIRLNNNDGGTTFFASLTDSDIPDVAMQAAFFLIPLDPIRARETMQRIAEGSPGEVRVAAKLTLSEWASGRLDPEWFMKK